MVSLERIRTDRTQTKEAAPSKEKGRSSCDILLISGPVGSGKSTLAEKLVELIKHSGRDAVRISSGAIYEEERNKGLSGVKLDRKVDNRVLEEATKAVEEGKIAVAESRALPEIIQNALEEINGEKPIVRTVILQVSPEVKIQRLSARGRLPVKEELQREQKIVRDLVKAHPELKGKDIMDPNIFDISINTDNFDADRVAQEVFRKIFQNKKQEKIEKPSPNLPKHGIIFSSN